MKKLLFSVVFIVLAHLCFSQDTVYCEVRTETSVKKFDVYVDNGNGKPIKLETLKYTSSIAVLKDFTDKGWKLKQFQTTSYGASFIQRYYLLEKIIPRKKD